MTTKKLHKKVNKFIEKIYINGYLDGMEHVEKEYKLEQDYMEHGCDKCKHRHKTEHEEPCKSCRNNYMDNWRLDETAD